MGASFISSGILNALLGQHCCNNRANFMAIKEFNGRGGRGFFLILEGKDKSGWYGFGEMLRFLLSPYLPMKPTPPLPEKLFVPVKHFYAQTVIEPSNSSSIHVRPSVWKIGDLKFSKRFLATLDH